MSEIDKQIKEQKAVLASSLAKCEQLLEAGKDLAERTVAFDNYLIQCARTNTPPDQGALARSLADLATKARQLLELYERD